MRILRRALHRAIGFFTGGSAEREFAAELESHLDMHVADNIRAGMTREAARRHAAMKLGNIAAVSASQREQRGLPRLESMVQDVRHSWRGLRRNPGFALACIGTLARFSLLAFCLASSELRRAKSCSKTWRAR